MTTPTPTKTREDGAIDYAYYMQQGREIRSKAALGQLRRLGAALRRSTRALRAIRPAKPGVAPRFATPAE